MSNVIAVCGESGTGKTTSMRNLNPKETYYIDCDKKGLSWKGWKQQYSLENGNYAKTDFPQTVKKALCWLNGYITDDKGGVSFDKNCKGLQYKVAIVDTLNGIMVADEMRRTKEKGYDKWQDLAQSVYEIVDYSLTMRDDITVIFICHTQTDVNDNGYMFTRIKTSGKKLDKITLESKFTTVLISKCIDGRYVFETQANFSTAKSPMGLFDSKEIDNDMQKVIEAFNEF